MRWRLGILPSRQSSRMMKNICFLGYSAATGRQVFIGIRQSIPSSNIESCDADNDTLPSFARGHTKRPRSSRL